MKIPQSTLRVVRAALIAFVAVSVVWVFAKDVSRTSPAGESPEPGTEPQASTMPPAYTLIYFHGSVRCASCRTLEALSRLTAAESLAPEIAAGQLDFKVVNFDEPAHRHYIDDFELPGSQLVIIRTINDPPHDYLQLQDVWYTTDDPMAFQEFVAGEVRHFMSAGEAASD